MATALARGCVNAGFVAADGVLACDPNEAARDAFAKQLPEAQVFGDGASVLQGADVVVAAVKPQVMPGVLDEIGPFVQSRHLIVSIAAGITLSQLTAGLPAGTRLVRVMPNTPSLIARGASCFSRGACAADDDAALVRQILTCVGDVHEVDERQLDAVTGLSGSGPAFIYEVIGALADGGVAMGLSPGLALSLAAQTARGAAEMVQSTGLQPSELRDQVTSPGGTTLAGLESLKRDDAISAFSRAVEAATKRSIELGRG